MLANRAEDKAHGSRLLLIYFRLLVLVLLSLPQARAAVAEGQSLGAKALRSEPQEDVLRHVWAVKLRGKAGGARELDALADSTAVSLGLVNGGRIDPFTDVFQFELHPGAGGGEGVWEGRSDGERGIRSVVHVDKRLSNHLSVVWAGRQRPLKRTKRETELEFRDPKFSQQWHLVNRKERGHDINVTDVWLEGVTGRGVVIAVVDDGLEYTNEDIAENYNSIGSYDFNSEDSDPAPNLNGNVDNTHGTKCAGLIAAVANNSMCAVGVAYEAEVSGIRMLDGTVTDILEGKSFVYKAHVNSIFSCSWGPQDDGETVEGPGMVAMEALELAINKGRYGYGNIYVFASGNGGMSDDHCNFDGYANSIYTVTIGAVDENNRMPYYAELCPAMLGVTYSNGRGGRSIVTTDAANHGGCTNRFSGTSAAAPIASGMIGLMLQVRRCLTWRDVQAILVYTAVKVDDAGAVWVKNGIGLHHSDQHGFGLLDTYRMTRVAGVWPLLPALRQWTSGLQEVMAAITGNGEPLLITVNVTEVKLTNQLNTLEYVVVKLSLDHTCRGALEYSVVSPMGTHSTLATTRKRDKSAEGLDGWNFATAKFWGESPLGMWTISIIDRQEVNKDMEHSGELSQWQLTLHGSELTEDLIQDRRRLVEEAVSSDVWSPLPCPPLPVNPKELHVAYASSHYPLWEKVIIVVVLVMVAVVMVHLVLVWGWECVSRRLKGFRHRGLPAVAFHKGRGTDAEERALLLIHDEAPPTLDEALPTSAENGDMVIVQVCRGREGVEEEVPLLVPEDHPSDQLELEQSREQLLSSKSPSPSGSHGGHGTTSSTEDLCSFDPREQTPSVTGINVDTRFAVGNVTMATDRTGVDIVYKAVGDREGTISFGSSKVRLLETTSAGEQHDCHGDSPRSLQSFATGLRHGNGSLSYGNGTASFADVEMQATAIELISNGIHGDVES